MPELSKLEPRDCPVCGSNSGTGVPFLERNFRADRVDAMSFASRKAPEYMSYALSRCPTCDAVYAREAPTISEIGAAYHSAGFDSKAEALDAAETYERALRGHLLPMPDKGGALEIGTGTGAFLQRLRRLGFTGLAGVEPSRAAIDAADEDIRPSIREGLFRGADFEAESFSLIACFMTLEHVSEPATLLRDAHRLMKPDGILACVVHDWRAWNNRVLGRRAPIIDIEHLQIFSRKSVGELFRRAGFVGIECRSFRNRYRWAYWNRMLPLPMPLKRASESLLSSSGLGGLRLSMNVGNLMVVARKRNDA